MQDHEAKINNLARYSELHPFLDSYPYLYCLFTPPQWAPRFTQVVVHLFSLCDSCLQNHNPRYYRHPRPQNDRGRMKAGEVKRLMCTVHAGLITGGTRYSHLLERLGGEELMSCSRWR